MCWNCCVEIARRTWEAAEMLAMTPSVVAITHGPWVPAHMQLWSVPSNVTDSCNIDPSSGQHGAMRRAGPRFGWWNVVHFFLQSVLLIHVLPPSSATIDPAQRQTLVDLYLATSGASWAVQDGWVSYAVSSNDPCTDSWHGVSCDFGNPQNVL